MLMLTPTAAEVVRNIASATNTPQQAGLRITTSEGADSFNLTVAGAPSEDDEVLSAEGARVFLDAKSAAYFDDKILDAGVDAGGNPSFTVEPQDFDE
ncbi:hypothetical protein [Nocardia sp. NPDC004722]